MLTQDKYSVASDPYFAVNIISGMTSLMMRLRGSDHETSHLPALLMRVGCVSVHMSKMYAV